MGNQIGFQKAGLGFIPLLEGTDGDLLFEQGSRTCGGDAMRALSSMRTQEAISRGSAHREELATTSIGQVKVPMPLQGLDQGRQKRYEPLGTDLVGRLPREIQSLLDFWSKRSLSPTARRLLDLLWMVEQPHRITTCVSCRSSNARQGAPLFVRHLPCVSLVLQW
jgi:hypothetical protein